MKCTGIARLLATLPALILPLAARAETIAGSASVIDAGTVQIGGEVIRLLDIEAPEPDQYCQQAVGDVTWWCGAEAAFALIEWIGQSDLLCESEGRDRFNRRLAKCTVQGEDVAVWLAENGWAVPSGDCDCEVIRQATARAQDAHHGLWMAPFRQPWEWRSAN